MADKTPSPQAMPPYVSSDDCYRFDTPPGDSDGFGVQVKTVDLQLIHDDADNHPATTMQKMLSKGTASAASPVMTDMPMQRNDASPIAHQRTNGYGRK